MKFSASCESNCWCSKEIFNLLFLIMPDVKLQKPHCISLWAQSMTCFGCFFPHQTNRIWNPEAELYFGKIAQHNVMECSGLQTTAARSYQPGSVRWGMTTQKKSLNKKKSYLADIYVHCRHVHKHCSYCGTKNNSSVFGSRFFAPYWNYWKAVHLGNNIYSS